MLCFMGLPWGWAISTAIGGVLDTEVIGLVAKRPWRRIRQRAATGRSHAQRFGLVDEAMLKLPQRQLGKLGNWKRSQ
jgi:hypothetical protein